MNYTLGSNTTTKANYITVTNPQPTAMWNATPLFTNITTGIIFVDNSTGTNITAGGGNFNWSFNNDATDKNVSPLRNWTHKFPCTALPTADSCYYSVNHSVTDSPGTFWSNTSWLNQTSYLRIFQNTSPTVTFTGTPPLSGVSQLSVTFTGTQVGAIKVDSWSWVFGDGNIGTGQTPTNVYSSAGAFTVTLTAVNYTLGSNTTTKANYITVTNPQPTAMWNATPLFTNITTGIIFVDNSTGTNITAGGGNFNWSFNNDATDKNVSPLRNWTHKFPCTALPTADSCYYSVNHSVTDSPVPSGPTPPG